MAFRNVYLNSKGILTWNLAWPIADCEVNYKEKGFYRRTSLTTLNITPKVGSNSERNSPYFRPKKIPIWCIAEVFPFNFVRKNLKILDMGSKTAFAY
jgi:hypothetical protein